MFISNTDLTFLCLCYWRHPRQPTFSPFPLYKTWQPINVKNRESPIFDGKITLLAGPTFLPSYTLAGLAGQFSQGFTIRTCTSALCLGKGVKIFCNLLSWLGWESDSLSQENFSPMKRSLLPLSSLIKKKRINTVMKFAANAKMTICLQTKKSTVQRNNTFFY